MEEDRLPESEQRGKFDLTLPVKDVNLARNRERRGAFLFENIIKLAAAGLGSGYSPLAPGTAGTLVGIPLFLILSKLSWPCYLAAIIAMSLAAVYICGEAEKIFQARDSQKIVLDEVIGLQFALFLASPTLPHIIAGFVLFRFFDIVKLFPAKSCEKLPGGAGVVADDIVAGIYANIVLLSAIRFINL